MDVVCNRISFFIRLNPFSIKDWAEFNCNSIKGTSGNYWITKYPLLRIRI